MLTRLRSLSMAAMVFLLLLLALFAGFMPLALPFGFAAGGVLDTGQVEPSRWWLGAALALLVYGVLSWRTARALRLWWLALLLSGAVLCVMTFSFVASLEQKQRAGHKDDGALYKPQDVAVVTALPLFWPEGSSVRELLQDDAPSEMPFPRASGHLLNPLGQLDAVSLEKADALLLVQPRVMQPEELVVLDNWVRAGGRAVIFADPLLIWPSGLSIGDPRRPPVTSLLDPLLNHWGLKLEPVREGAERVGRHMLESGHVLLLAGASHFSLTQGDVRDDVCTLLEAGLMAQCRIGKGQVRLVADADLLDDRLWLADRRWPQHPAAQTSDSIMLMDAWLSDPAAEFVPPPLRRVVDDAVLVSATRLAMVVLLLWVVLGWFGQKQFFDESGAYVNESEKNR